MKTVLFRPLRRIHKTNKIVVASYGTWRKVVTADYSSFNLVLREDHKKMPLDEYVYDHKGQLLYFYTYNPANVPVFEHTPDFDLNGIVKNYKYYGISWAAENRTNYHMPGVDCDGVPVFSHYSADYLATHWKDVSEFEPLTVKTVMMWYGWFLFELKNSNLIK